MSVGASEKIDLFGRAVTATADAEHSAEVSPGNAAPTAESRGESGDAILPASIVTISKPGRAPFGLREALKDAGRVGVGLLGASAIAERKYPGEPDKQLHALAGGLIAGVTSSYVTHQTGSRLAGVAAGVVAAGIAGVAKERFDRAFNGHPSRADERATLLGGLAVALTFSIEF